jgi:hypothetical protein
MTGVSSAASLDAFPTDPDFPQLRVASDPALMLEVFRAHLKPASGNPCHVDACVPFRFRCRQSTSRCVLQYTLRLVDPGTGRQWDQWVTGVVYAEEGEAKRRWQEMRAADPRQEIPQRWLTFEPVDFIPDLQMLVQVFPYDRKLPNLARVLGGALPGVPEHAIEPMRYRTELGAALRYTGSTPSPRCYLKVYRNDRGAETYRLLQELCERSGGGAERVPYSVVRPLAYASELRTLVLAEAPGIALQDILLQGDGGEAVRAVARAVAALNQDHLRTAEHHSLADQLDDVTQASTLVQWACPDARAEVRAITAAVVQGLKEVPPAPIHRDLKTDHIFLSGQQVIFIDLDSVALGDPVRDPAHLFAHIAGRVGLDALSRGQARATAAAFVEEYFAHVPAPWCERFALHGAAALLEVARGIFKRQEPQWLDKVTAAIEEAGAVLSGKSIG